MTTAAAAPTLTDRVEPYWPIPVTTSQPARASGERPGPSAPNSRTHRWGSSRVSSGTAPATLSTPTTGSPSVVAHAWRASASGWCRTSRYRSVTMAPRRFHRRRPTTCTDRAPKALAERTIEPMLKSWTRFSTATWNGWERAATSAAMASTLHPR